MYMFDSDGVKMTVDINETAVIISDGSTLRLKGFFVINDGAVNVTYKVYGSPTGIKTGDRDGQGNIVDATEEGKHWNDMSLTGKVSAGSNVAISLVDKPFNFYKLTLKSVTGTATTRSWLMQQLAK